MSKDHPAYSAPAFGRLFREAVAENVRDYIRMNEATLLVPGYWLIRRRKKSPLIPAWSYWTDAEPGNPENKLDRWPLPFIAGEIGGELADPLDIFCARDRIELVPQRGLTVEQEYAFRCADLKHAKRHRPEDPLANPERAVNLARIPPILPPGVTE
jgi:hypothetical protein